MLSMRGILLLAVACWCLLAGQAQDADQPPDVVRAVREGMAEALEARFGDGRTPDEIHLIAQAYVNKARLVADPRTREQAFERAADRYRAWIDALSREARAALSPTADVALASARVEFGGVLMGLQAAGELDRFEVSDGRQADREKLASWLGAAREQYRLAAVTVMPLYRDIHRREDEYLVAGIYDTIIQLKLDIAFNQAWAYYYLGVIAPEGEQRQELHRGAERDFQELLDSGQTGAMRARCLLGLGVVQRELRRYEAAESSLTSALQETSNLVVEAQVRYELARSHIRTGRFAEARTVLRPLLDEKIEELPEEHRAARFYINLARLWDANSYLVESAAIQAQVAESTAKSAVRLRAQRARETGLAKLNRLARRGGPWPALVQLYVASGLEPGRDLKSLSAIELLYTARQLSEAQRYHDARRRLEEAAARPEFKKDAADGTPEQREIAGQILVELGKCYYRLDRLADAAEAFDRVAQDYCSHELAPQAATFAYQLWAQIAQKSHHRRDYERLAATLLNLLRHFPEHPKREEAAWLLPVAWQAAGDYARAGAEFAKISRGNPHWEEAQFRRGICRRRMLEAQRGTTGNEQYRLGAGEVAAELVQYADTALRRAADNDTPSAAGALRRWSAEARVNAAEVLIGPGVGEHERGLRAVEGFESTYPDSALVGRVLAVRIRAQRGLRRFEEATADLERYLQAVPAERAGAVLSSLAAGVEEEVERLRAAGEAEAARKLAGESVETFARLEQWVRQDAQRSASVPVVAFGHARMLYFAGDYDPAQEILAELRREDAQNGNYQRLMALVLTARLSADAPAAQIKAAQDAWAVLLQDTTLRKRAPERFWEARYNWLALLLQKGAAADVEHAIKQELVWYPDLGGGAWRAELLELRRQARRQLGLPEEEPPATESAPAP